MRAILLADVDLLWNGGIGTYVKAESETDAEVGDKANDPIRVNGGALRCRCVEEGGNRPHPEGPDRVLPGRRSDLHRLHRQLKGVDTSDHEVNIKILLDRVVVEGDLTEKQRNDLLASMTEEVGTLVLADNYEQNIALASAARNAPALMHVHEDWVRRLERQSLLDRALESAASRKAVAERIEGRKGLTTPGFGADGLHQDRAGGRADRDRPARRPVPAHRPVQLLPVADAADLPRADGEPPAARDHRHPGGQRVRQRRRITFSTAVRDRQEPEDFVGPVPRPVRVRSQINVRITPSIHTWTLVKGHAPGDPHAGSSARPGG